MQERSIFLSGGTGYVGRALVSLLLERGHDVHILTRPGSERKVPPGAKMVKGSALNPATFADALTASSTVVHLTGTPHPAPWKEAQFRAVDLVSLRASSTAAHAANVEHFVYVSVAQPAPVMRCYIQVRQECEAILNATRLRQTILRPWYVLGPGHRWPLLLKPIYSLLEALPSTHDSAVRLGLVTLPQMAQALLWAVENPPEKGRVMDVPAIRSASLDGTVMKRSY